MSLLYKLSVGAYASVIKVASVFNPKAKLWVNGRKGLLEKIRFIVSNQDRPIWIHCASLGEFEQGRPIIEAIKKDFPSKKILLTFFSPSGYEIRKKFPLADYVFYLPIDSPANAKDFIEAVNPVLAIFIKYEFWNNYFTALHKKSIPLFLASAIFRKEQPFFSWYGGFWRGMLHKTTYIFVQDEASYSLLKGIGISHVSVAGDTRFDRVLEASENLKSFPHVKNFCANSKVLVAGSTWIADEQILAEIMKISPKNVKFIIAPHEVDESHLQQMKKQLNGLDFVLFSELNKSVKQDCQILIIDNIGMLSQLYQYADLAYIGGGFGSGIHNVLEPAIFGLPIMIGPKYHKFKEAVELISKGSAFVVNNKSEAISTFNDLMIDSSKTAAMGLISKNYVLDNIGATDKIMEKIKEVINQ
jgi:3-deoxy-D-manno-octulosonic-acid transferase